MSRWFRHYAGMVRDEKLVRVAVKCGQSIERVVWVWGAILESAAEIDEDGRYDFDAAEAAYFLRADEADIHAVETALASAGRVAEGCVVKWGDRQFKSDRSATRQGDYRERKRQRDGGSQHQEEAVGVTAEPSDGQVTVASRHGDAPETETELDTETPLRGVGARKPKTSSRGTRLSSTWEPSERNIEAAIALGMPRAEIPREAQRFRNYWVSKPGAGGVKLDWDATWENWVSRTCETKGYAPIAGHSSATNVVWLQDADPLWASTCDRIEAATGKRPEAKGSKYGKGLGAFVPAEFIPDSHPRDSFSQLSGTNGTPA